MPTNGMTINGLNPLSALTADDKIPVWDTGASGEPTKEITAQNMANSVKSLASLPNTTEMNTAIEQSTADVIRTGDVVNSLTSTATDKPLSAAQGKALNEAITQSMAKWTWERNPANLTTILLNINAKQVSYVEITGTQPVGMPSDLTGNQWGVCITVGSTSTYLRYQLFIPETGSSQTMYFRTRPDGNSRWIKITGQPVDATT